MPKALAIEANLNRDALMRARKRKQSNRRNPDGSRKSRVFTPAHLLFVGVGPEPWRCTCGMRNSSSDRVCSNWRCYALAPWA